MKLYNGDCLEVLKKLEDNSIDSCVCDPPYHLTSIVSRYGKENSAPAKAGVYARSSKGFMGKTWDGGDIAFKPEVWIEVLRVLKPGGHLLAFGGTRTYHRMACAIEDAGFEIRDQLGWMYGSGFPKSHDVSKGIDKAAGKLAAQSVGFNVAGKSSGLGTIQRPELRSDHPDYSPYIPATPEAAQWQGWGTALKPAWEPICLARKPLIGTVAKNVQEYGTGAINIDGCRVNSGEPRNPGFKNPTDSHRDMMATSNVKLVGYESPIGRWPANIIHDGSEEVLAVFPESKGQLVNVKGTEPSSITNSRYFGRSRTKEIYGKYNDRFAFEKRDDEGSAARFFYCAKTSEKERGEGNNHPTVKPIALMSYLCRLITPPNGTVLDPFMGSGSTGKAALDQKFDFIGIEKEKEYFEIAKKRIKKVDRLPE